MRACLILASAFVLTLLPLAAAPNVILIISDDQGYPDLGCIGTKPLITPNLDRLAAEGVRGTSFYVTWPACTPSRGSVLAAPVNRIRASPDPRLAVVPHPIIWKPATYSWPSSGFTAPFKGGNSKSRVRLTTAAWGLAPRWLSNT